MRSPKEKKKQILPILPTKELLIESAKTIFSEKGYDGTTVKEIAAHAGVNISLISYHFQGKEGLLKACIEAFGHSRLKEAEQILTTPESIEDLRAKIKLWGAQFLQCHVEDDKICKILHRENVLEHPFLRDIFESTFLKAFSAVTKFLQKAQEKKILRKNVDPLAAAGLLYGAMIHVGRTRDIQKKWFHNSIDNETYRSHVLDQFLLIFLQGIS